MDFKKIALWGGGALAVLVGGYLVISRGGGGGGDVAEAPGVASYYPPMISGYGSGSIDPGGLNQSMDYSTDSEIDKLLANQVTVATIQSTSSMQTAQVQKDIALAGYASDLELTREQNSGALNLQKAVDAGKAMLIGAQSTADVSLAGVTGANAYNLQALTGSQQQQLAVIQGQQANVGKAIDTIAKTGGKINLPGKGGILTISHKPKKPVKKPTKKAA